MRTSTSLYKVGLRHESRRSLLLSTAVAYIIYFRLLVSAGATNLLLVTFLIPVSALLLGITFLDERLDPNHFIGMALIGVGLAMIDGRSKKVPVSTSYWI